jgi:hypothetical protein
MIKNDHDSKNHFTLKAVKTLFTDKLKFIIIYTTKNQHLQSFLSFTDLADRFERV